VTFNFGPGTPLYLLGTLGDIKARFTEGADDTARNENITALLVSLDLKVDVLKSLKINGETPDSVANIPQQTLKKDIITTTAHAIASAAFACVPAPTANPKGGSGGGGRWRGRGRRGGRPRTTAGAATGRPRTTTTSPGRVQHPRRHLHLPAHPQGCWRRRRRLGDGQTGAALPREKVQRATRGQVRGHGEPGQVGPNPRASL
jgi:hypothetical protein